MGIYLGLDLSTQGLKGSIIDTSKCEIIFTESLNFGKDMPEYNCPHGFLDDPNPLLKHSDPLMWAAALDKLFSMMKAHDAPLSSVEGISGSGQQHGSVYLNEQADAVLANLSPEKNIADQIMNIFSRKTSPIWMDSSTTEECQKIEEAIGKRLQEDTGSPATERFTGPQIRKFFKESPEAYRNTAQIHLVSSFMATLLCGKHASIDYGDGAGMNLLNLKTLKWDNEICQATAPDLLAKLPPPVRPDAITGKLHHYFTKYGFKEAVPVNVWSGDNPCSLAGTGGSQPGTAVISLGTSDTFFASMKDYVTDPSGYGHVFGSPSGGFMSLICFKNGSLARERVKTDCNADWDDFDKIGCDMTEAGNNGNIMLPYFIPEITPLVMDSGVQRHGNESFMNGSDTSAQIRAVMEAQAISMKLHSSWIGGEFKKIRVTGGASKSQGLCQILANVFQADIEKISSPDSASLGAAMRAANAIGAHDWENLSSSFCKITETVKPQLETAVIYGELLKSYEKFEDSILKSIKKQEKI